MKAAFFDAVGRPLRIDDAPEPAPSQDEVVLRVAACGICGSDLHITEDPHPSASARVSFWGTRSRARSWRLGAMSAIWRWATRLRSCPCGAAGNAPAAGPAIRRDVRKCA